MCVKSGTILKLYCLITEFGVETTIATRTQHPIERQLHSRLAKALKTEIVKILLELNKLEVETPGDN